MKVTKTNQNKKQRMFVDQRKETSFLLKTKPNAFPYLEGWPTTSIMAETGPLHYGLVIPGEDRATYFSGLRKQTSV